MFVKTRTIAKATNHSAGVFKVLIIAAAVVIVVCILFSWWKKRTAQKNKEQEDLERTLKTPLETFGSTPMDDLKAKYDNQDVYKRQPHASHAWIGSIFYSIIYHTRASIIKIIDCLKQADRLGTDSLSLPGKSKTFLCCRLDINLIFINLQPCRNVLPHCINIRRKLWSLRNHCLLYTSSSASSACGLP